MTRAKLRFVLLAIVFGVIGLSASALLLPKPPGAEGSLYYAAIGTPVTLLECLFGIGASILFFMARKRFKEELKSAYRLLAFATLSAGTLTLVVPYVEYNGLWGDVRFVTITYMPYFLLAVFLYLGIRRLYKRLELGGPVASLPFMVIATLVLWFGYTFIPHIDDWAGIQPAYLYNVMQILVITPAVAINAALFMALRVWRHTGQGYRRPLGWMVTGLAFEAFALTATTVLQVIGYDNPYFNSRAYEIPYILGNIGLLMAGYYFTAVGLVQVRRATWWNKLFHADDPQGEATSFDIITYVAGMTAALEPIKPHLDKMRSVSAKVASGKEASTDDQQVLKSVYLEVEDYLIGSDRLRSFNKDELRADVVTHFGLNPQSNQTFWPLLQK